MRGTEQTQSPSWLPFELPWDDAPLDLSFLYAAELPAGRHGFLTVSGDAFVFEDETPARFWGVNLAGSANFPKQRESERIARRLAKFGVNLVRVHQMDSDWSTPNLFQFNFAEPQTSTRVLDDRSLERLDCLIARLKEEGIYVYLDLLVYRRFLPGDGVRNARALGPGAKPYCIFDRRLIELQKEFNERLWTHTNSYTGLKYLQDPAIVLTELVNECSFHLFPPTLEPYRSELAVLYQQWAEREEQPVEANPAFEQPTAQIAAFFAHLEREYYRELASHLREIGVRIPITGTTGTGGSMDPKYAGTNLALLESQSVTDFTDTNVYWNDPSSWEAPTTVEFPPSVRHRPMAKEARPSYAHVLSMRAPTLPFFVSEWGHNWPDEWRAESPIAYAAVGAFQDWDGLAVYTYRNSAEGPVDRIGGGASTLNGTFLRNHYAIFNDPALFGLFYNAALLFRRGDVQVARERAVVRVDDEEGWRLFTTDDLPALDSLAELHRASVALPGYAAEADHVLSREPLPADQSASELLADTGELGRNHSDGIGWVDTARTKAVYGFIGKRDRVSLDGFEIAATTDFATVALSSLTDDPIRDSPMLLLTAVGRSDNSGTAYDNERTHQLDYGHAPVLIEPVEAQLSLTTGRDLEVWAIGSRGEAITRLAATCQNGRLTFHIGSFPVGPAQRRSTIYYLIRT